MSDPQAALGLLGSLQVAVLGVCIAAVLPVLNTEECIAAAVLERSIGVSPEVHIVVQLVQSIEV